MDFNNFNFDHTCDCFNNAFEDNSNYYAIKIMKNQIRVQDFNFYWDKGKRSDDNNDCEKTCSLKGVSVSIFNEESNRKLKTFTNNCFLLHLSISRI